jgi:hypothetical protein
MSSSYISSSPCRLHGVAGQLYFTFTCYISDDRLEEGDGKINTAMDISEKGDQNVDWILQPQNHVQCPVLVFAVFTFGFCYWRIIQLHMLN